MAHPERPAIPSGGSFLLAGGAEASFAPEDFTDQHRLIAQTAETFANQEIVPAAEKMEQQDFATTRRVLQQAAAVGLTGVDVPERYGGLGLDFISSAIVADRMAKYGSFSVTFGAHTGIATLPIVFFGNEEQKQKYLPRLAASEWVGAYALSEAEAGSDALAARAQAVKSADGASYVLNGEKMWISNAGFADLFIVFAKVNGKLTAFLVERNFTGVSVGPEEHKMGIRGSSTCPLILRDAVVPAANVLGEEGKGHLVAFETLNIGRFKLGAACVGGARQCLQQATRYALQRKAFGKSIATFGLVRQSLAAMAADLFVSESIVYRTVGLISAALAELEEGTDPASRRRVLDEYAVECSIVKVQTSEMLDAAVDANVQIHGGYGFVQGYPAERPYRDARVNRIFEGTNEINRLLISGMLLRRAAAGRLALMEAVGQVQQELLNRPAPTPATLGAAQVEAARQAVLFAAGVAFQQYRESISEREEILAALSNLVLDLYAMQSVRLRVDRLAAEQRPWGEALLQWVLHHHLDHSELQARAVLTASSDGDTLRSHLALLRRLYRHEPVHEFELGERIAEAVIEAQGYPLH